MKTINKIGVMSLAKVQAVITGIFYLLLGIVVSILGRVQPDIASTIGMPAGIIGIITMTISGIIGGFIVGALIAWLYNMVAPKVGGIQIEIK